MHTFRADQLTDLATNLLRAAGLDAEKCRPVAEILVEADLMGHDTHGLAQLPAYLDAIADGSLVASGDAAVLSDRGAVALWDGGWHSGVWLTLQALETAAAKARQFGIGAVSVAHSHHIACLQAYLPRYTAQGLVAMITCSDPSVSAVAPFGGLDPVFSPDPIAIGIPTASDPILIDMSSSITTMAMAKRNLEAGSCMRGPWLQTVDGVATNDPRVLASGGTFLPTGGLDHGHKGYGMALTVEALSQGLSGHGRANAERRWGASIYVQVFDPTFFAGGEMFVQNTEVIGRMCRASRVRPGSERVRLPGENAQGAKAIRLATGVPVKASVSDALRHRSEVLDVPLPLSQP